MTPVIAMEKPKKGVQIPVYNRGPAEKVHQTDVAPVGSQTRSRKTEPTSEDAAIRERNQKTNYCEGYQE
jgi:hypothetical protein